MNTTIGAMPFGVCVSPLAVPKTKRRNGIAVGKFVAISVGDNVVTFKGLLVGGNIERLSVGNNVGTFDSLE